MKTISLMLISILLMASNCPPAKVEPPDHKKPKTTNSVEFNPDDNTFNEVRYDSCEYLIFQSSVYAGGSPSMVHKGNCSNPIHK